MRFHLSTFTRTSPIVTVSGNVVPGNQHYATSGEICLVVDDFTTFTYKDGDYFLNYHLYIPEGYETKAAGLKNLPLVVHYPSGDYRFTDYKNLYRGALFSHPEVLYWATEDVQAANPAFVITVGGERDAEWGNEYSKSIMQQSYVAIIKQLAKTYNIDTSRIYAISLAGGSGTMYYTMLANPTFSRRILPPRWTLMSLARV
jgi:predicted peptidase